MKMLDVTAVFQRMFKQYYTFDPAQMCMCMVIAAYR